MWFNFIKIKTKNIPTIVGIKDLKKKYKLFDEKKIINSFSTFINLKKNFYVFFKKTDIQIIITYYLSLKKVIKKHNLNNFNHSLLLKLTKKQLFSTIFSKSKINFFCTNGMFLKKLALNKNKKKDNKVSVLNLKKTAEFIKARNIKTLLINVIYSKTFVFKYLNILKKNINVDNLIYIYTPKTSFSQNKYKKIKSIKRKLKKRYTYSI